MATSRRTPRTPLSKSSRRTLRRLGTLLFVGAIVLLAFYAEIKRMLVPWNIPPVVMPIAFALLVLLGALLIQRSQS